MKYRALFFVQSYKNAENPLTLYIYIIDVDGVFRQIVDNIGGTKMKFRRIAASMLAAALVTSTVAFAEDVAAERDLILEIENDKGTYTFTDEELEAFSGYFNEDNGYDSDRTIITNRDCGIFGEDSVFSVTAGNDFSLNNIFKVSFELINIEKDADGNTSFERITRFSLANSPAVIAIWGPLSYPSFGEAFGDTTLNASVLIEHIQDHSTDLGGTPVYYDTNDVDMVLINFHINDVLDENGYAVSPSDGHNPYVINNWLLTESAAAMLNEANSGTTAPDDTTGTTDDTTGTTDDAAGTTDDTAGSTDDTAGSTDGADSEDKQSADTGAQGVAAAAGIALAAGAAVLFSRKRK